MPSVYRQRRGDVYKRQVLEHWNILVGRQPLQNIGLRTEDGWDISGEDVRIWLEAQGENSFNISAYCEKLLPMLREEEGRAWWMLTTLTDQVLGEISHMRYIDSFDVLEKPKAEPSFLLSQLPDALKDRGLELSTDPEAYLESYLGYKMEPNKDPDADWRLDVMAGSTCCVPLINGYLNADNDFMDNLHADGAVAGFFCYPLDTLREGMNPPHTGYELVPDRYKEMYKNLNDASVYGNTRNAAEYLADVLQEKGQKTVLYDLARCDKAKAVADAFRYGFNTGLKSYLAFKVEYKLRRRFFSKPEPPR